MKWFLLALQYLPHVLSAVKAIEDVIGAGNGVTKKQMVLSSLSAASAACMQVPEDHVKVVSSLIDSTVSILNISGIFSKSQVVKGPQ